MGSQMPGTSSPDYEFLFFFFSFKKMVDKWWTSRFNDPNNHHHNKNLLHVDFCKIAQFKPNDQAPPAALHTSAKM